MPTWKMPRKYLLAAALSSGCAVLGGIFPASASAALLTGSVTSNVTGTRNLTAEGSVGWAIWDYQAGNTGNSGAPSNTNGETIISNVSAASSGGTPRGITGTVGAVGYSYTDGTSPVSQTNAIIGAVADSNLPALGAGVKFSVTGNPSVPEVVNVYVADYNGAGTFTATLNGATTYSNVQTAAGLPTSTREVFLYSLNFQPNAVGDTLQISYVYNGANNGAANYNVDLQAVAVSVPEPASFASLASVGAILLLRRRRIHDAGR